jgi:uncharacterized protein YkwD
VAAVLAAAFLAPAGASALDLERLIAPTNVCADQTDPTAVPAVQEEAMRCMTNFARSQMSMGSLADVGELDVSAGAKSDDILRCDSFSHEACGRPFTYWMQRVGYIPARCWRAGENIAWGTGSLGSVRSIFRTWIHSTDHRENILGPFSQIGIGLDVGNLEGHSGVHVWTQHFGSHCAPVRERIAPPRAHLAARHAVS